MPRILRITLMWLLALAVPVQGFAAVAMFGCGPGHHGGTGMHAHVAAMDEYAAKSPQHLHDAAFEPDSSRHHDGSAEAGDGHMLKAHGASGKIAKGSCSACASCCVAAAIPVTVASFQPAPATDFFVPLAPRSVASFLTDGPERPPRSILA